MKTYSYIVEKCPDTGLYVGYVSGFPGAHSQAETLDELQRNMQEVIEMCYSRMVSLSWRLNSLACSKHPVLRP